MQEGELENAFIKVLENRDLYYKNVSVISNRIDTDANL